MDHPDQEEILSKMMINISNQNIHTWLKEKYSGPNENKFVISEKLLKTFKEEYLDFYSLVKADLNKTKLSLKNPEQEITLAVQNNPAYKDILIETANKQLDIRATINRLATAIETRVSQIFDIIQEQPRDVNIKVERAMIEYCQILGDLLEKIYKFTEENQKPDQVIQHNLTIQTIDQHVSIFHEVIRDVLAQMDLETSMYFMEVFNEKMEKIKPPSKEIGPSLDSQMAQVQIIGENINKRVNS